MKWVRAVRLWLFEIGAMRLWCARLAARTEQVNALFMVGQVCDAENTAINLIMLGIRRPGTQQRTFPISKANTCRRLSPSVCCAFCRRRKGDPYMCGHLHTLGGFVRTMYTRHPAGNLELEAADWKDGRM